MVLHQCPNDELFAQRLGTLQCPNPLWMLLGRDSASRTVRRSQSRPAIGSQYSLAALLCLVTDCNLFSFCFGLPYMNISWQSPIVLMMDWLHSGRNIAVLKLLFQCYQLAIAFLKWFAIVSGDMPLEAYLLQSLDPALGQIVIRFHFVLDFLVCFSRCATPLSQWWIGCISGRNIAVPKLLFECYQLATVLGRSVDPGLNFHLLRHWILLREVKFKILSQSSLEGHFHFSWRSFNVRSFLAFLRKSSWFSLWPLFVPATSFGWFHASISPPTAWTWRDR